MSTAITWSISPCMILSNPSRTPSTSTPSSRARMVAALMTLSTPGAGPPPTKIARLLRSVIESPQECLVIRVRQPECLGHGRVHHVPFDDVQPEEQRGIVLARLLPPLAGEPLRIR